MTHKIVRAIDLGYGFTKFIENVNGKGEPKASLFPSIAIKSSRKGLGGGYLSERETIEVLHNGVMYEVGKDAILLAKDNDGRNLNNNYTSTNDYGALMKAALKSMNVPVIDGLVIGTPVKKTEELKAKLKKEWQGEIDLDGNKKIIVKEVMVVSQPLGGFALYGTETNTYQKIKKQNNLVIDVGFLTVDWITVSNMKVIDGDSDNRGIGVILREVASRMGEGAENLMIMDRIDHALRTSTHEIEFKGNKVSIKEHLPYIHEVIEKSIETLMTRVGGLGSIDNIVLLGGGAHLFYNTLAKQAKGFEIKTTAGKSFSNVLGFQLIGESKYL